MDDPVDTICLWQDSESVLHATRCTIDLSTGNPIDFPPNAECLFILEYDRGHEPTFYDEALLTEMGIDNSF